MIRTDGKPTIAWADLPRAETCPVLTVPGRVTRVHLVNPSHRVRAAVQRQYPDAEIVLVAA